MPRRSQFFPAGHSPRLIVLLAIILVGLLPGINTEALAQGTSGILPDPISGRQLSEYAARIELSDQQRLAIDSYHSQYLDQFRELRDGDITDFLDKTNNLMRSFMFAPDSKEAKKSLDDLDRLMNRIKLLDQQLFNQIETVMSEVQVAALARVRQHRERTRYRSGLVRFVGYANAGARVDLSTIVESIDLPAEDRDVIDPTIAMYEGELTRSTRRLFDETQLMFADLMKQLEALTAAADGQPPRGMWGGMRDILAESSKGVMGQASAISKLNLRTFQSIAAVLPEEPARILQSAFYEDAYPEIERPAMAVLSRFDAALELDGLSADQKESIEVARTDLRAQHDRLAVRMIDLLEDIRKEAGLLRFGGPSGGPEQAQYEDLQKKRNEVNELAMERLAVLLGPDLQADLDEARAAKRRERRGARGSESVVIRSANGAGGVRGESVTRATADSPDGSPAGSPAPGLDPYIPGPITRQDLDRCSRFLALSDDEQAVLQSLHGGYLDSFASLRETHVQPILDAGAKLWVMDSDSGRLKPPSVEAIDAQYALRRSALVAINELDEFFLSDVRLILSGPDIDDRLARMRMARARKVYNRTGGSGSGSGVSSAANRAMRSFMGGSSDEENIDLINMLERQVADDEAWAHLDSVLIDYERQLVTAFKRRYELSLEVANAGDRAGAESAANRAAGGERGPRDRGQRGESRGGRGAFGAAAQLMGTTGRELQEAGRAVVELNRGTLDRLQELLGQEADAALRNAYRRAAHPDVYKDPGSADGSLRGALSLEDLTATQRSRISDVLDEYLEPYASLCEKMADLEAQAAEDNRGDFRNRDWQKFQERRNALERLRFDRTELNDKSLRRLRSILSEEQAQRIGLVVTD